MVDRLYQTDNRKKEINFDLPKNQRFFYQPAKHTKPTQSKCQVTLVSRRKPAQVSPSKRLLSEDHTTDTVQKPQKSFREKVDRRTYGKSLPRGW